MKHIKQDTTIDLIFNVATTKPFFLLVAENRCSHLKVFFNADNLASAGCPPKFTITEVGYGGIEDLNNGQIRLNPAGSWEISLYEQNVQYNKAPIFADLLTTEYFKVISDGICCPPTPSGIACPIFTDVIITDAMNPASPIFKSSGELYTCFAPACAGVDVTDSLNPLSPIHVPDGGAYVCTACPFSVITDALNPASPVGIAPEAPYTCFNINTATCQQLNDNLTSAQRQVIQQVKVTKSGQTTSYAAGDDGTLQSGRGVDFFTLSCNNPSGNTNRFEELVANFITNWRDKTMIYKIQQGNQTWANMFLAIAVQNAIPLGGYSNWRAFNCVDAVVNACFEGTVGGGYYNYPPFLATVISPYNAWTGNTTKGSTTNAFAMYMRNTNTWQIAALAKTNTYPFYLIRDF